MTEVVKHRYAARVEDIGLTIAHYPWQLHAPGTASRQLLGTGRHFGLTENDGHENDGPSKLQDMKLQDMKKTDQIAGHENAGHENDGPSSMA